MGSVVPHKFRTSNTSTNNSTSDNSNSINSQKKASCVAIYVYTITSFSFLLIIQSFSASSTLNHIQIGYDNHNFHVSIAEKIANNQPVQVLHIRNGEQKQIFHGSETPISTVILSFHPLKNSAVPPYTHRNKTWFMSTLVGRPTHSLPEHFVFPSKPPNDRILCIDAQKKHYTLATSSNTFPAEAIVAPGLTYLADSFYDYENPWHGLNAISPFFSWRREMGRCDKPTRFVLFKRGNVLVKKVGNWVHEIMKANLDGEVSVNDGILSEAIKSETRNKPTLVCFERAVVMRRGLGGMEGKNRRRLFDMMRCKAWKFCMADRDGDKTTKNAAMESTGTSINSAVNDSTAVAVSIQVSLLLREGNRGFANETAVINVLQKECRKLPCKCAMRTLRLAAGDNRTQSNMSFCEQVRTMRNTDVLVSTHGAQLTNMMFMPPDTSVMEMFPTGWLQSAGSGQFIYQWLADWSQLHYEGAWRDPHGINCSHTSSSTSNYNKSEDIDMTKRCFADRQKNQKVGIDGGYLAHWIAWVLAKAFARKTKMNFKTNYDSIECPCD